jgi:hypothetical protein
MLFTVLPVVDTMIDLYEKPRAVERFQEYIKMLQGETKGDLAFPISGFNPMAKEHILDHLKELKKVGAEQIMEDALVDINEKFNGQFLNRIFKVALNLSDDLKGGWTNRFTSDYDSKFKINGLISRDFCTPVFWTSEKIIPQEISRRTQEYVFRTIYWLTYPKPVTLKEHVLQEIFVSKQMAFDYKDDGKDFSTMHNFYLQHENATDYSVIFNFFYGDKGSQSLGFPTFRIKSEMTGFEYAGHFAGSEE